MREIPLKSFGDEKKGDFFDYEEVIRIIVTRPPDPRQGLSIAEVRQANRILDALDNRSKDTLSSCGVFILEDIDYSYLKNRVNSHRWGQAARVIEDFVSDIDHAKAFKPNSVENFNKGEQGLKQLNREKVSSEDLQPYLPSTLEKGEGI